MKSEDIQYVQNRPGCYTVREHSVRHNVTQSEDIQYVQYIYRPGCYTVRTICDLCRMLRNQRTPSGPGCYTVREHSVRYIDSMLHNQRTPNRADCYTVRQQRQNLWSRVIMLGGKCTVKKEMNEFLNLWTYYCSEDFLTSNIIKKKFGKVFM